MHSHAMLSCATPGCTTKLCNTAPLPGNASSTGSYGPAVSPYTLNLLSQQPNQDGTTRFCFQLYSLPAQPEVPLTGNGAICYKNLTQSISKVAIKTSE